VPNTNKMQWPFPAKDRDPWFETFEQMATAMDSSGYASREDRQIIMGGGGDVTFDAGTNSLTWAEALDFYSMISGFKVSVAATTVAIADGEVIYLNLNRSPQQNTSVSVAAANQVPNTDDAMAIAVRVGAVVFWRHGSKVNSGETVNIFGVPGTSDQGDTYERNATFGVPNGAFLGESTLGRVMIAGSLIGLSAEALEAVTGGTITVNVKINAVTKLTVVLNTTDSILDQIASAPGTHPVGVGDQVTVEVIGAGLVTASTLDDGLTVNVGLSTGILLPPGGLPDASASIKGATRLSLDPDVATAPIAVGDNDPRLTESRKVIRTIAQPADGSAFTVTIAPAMPSTNYIIVATLATVAAHFTVSTPEVGKTVNDFTVETSAEPADGDTIYFMVVEI
jgi:hypothetical protein